MKPQAGMSLWGRDRAQKTVGTFSAFSSLPSLFSCLFILVIGPLRYGDIPPPPPSPRKTRLLTYGQIRRRFTFHPERGWSMNNFAEDVMRKVGRKFRSPMAVLNFVLPISKTLQSYTKDKATRDLVVGITMATLMIPQVCVSVFLSFVSLSVSVCCPVYLLRHFFSTQFLLPLCLFSSLCYYVARRQYCWRSHAAGL